MTTPSRPSSHEPARPSWRCATCHDDWPCSTRRGALLSEFGASKVGLALQLAPYFSQAVEDHPLAPAVVLYGRFLGWVREVRR